MIKIFLRLDNYRIVMYVERINFRVREEVYVYWDIFLGLKDLLLF